MAVSAPARVEARRWRSSRAKLAAAWPAPGRWVLQKIDTLTPNSDSHAFDQLVATVRDVARLAADQDMPTSERIGMLSLRPARRAN